MKKKIVAYKLINILVLLVATLIFVSKYEVAEIFVDLSLGNLFVITASVIIVHFLKAFRLYLALYDSGLRRHGYSKIYCKVTPVSILFPFKLGEIFRMFCYGYEINNMLKGVVTVALDRFMDTTALVTMIIVVRVISGAGIIVPLVYLLIGFLVIAGLLFATFPAAYKYWKTYMLRADGTPRKIGALKFLENVNLVYGEISNVSKGRGIILYAISILAWITEMSCVALLNRMNENSNLAGKISVYLTSALANNQSIELKKFIFISVILMIIIYTLVKLIEVVKGERD